MTNERLTQCLASQTKALYTWTQCDHDLPDLGSIGYIETPRGRIAGKIIATKPGAVMFGALTQTQAKPNNQP